MKFEIVFRELPKFIRQLGSFKTDVYCFETSSHETAFHRPISYFRVHRLQMIQILYLVCIHCRVNMQQGVSPEEIVIVKGTLA